MSQLPVRIVKVGGSLLEREDLAEALQSWLRSQMPANTILLAGGGELCEVIRTWDARLKLGDEHSHWLCVDLLDATSHVLSKLLPEAAWSDDIEVLRQFCHPIVIFAPAAWLREREKQSTAGPPLPHSWDVTSDSIAACLYLDLAADELVLLKSTTPGKGESIEQLSSRNFVDPHFAKLGDFPVSFLTLPRADAAAK